ncbi:hypothetical protein J6TS7_20830 [Paenibacillus dendritiformis]|uniref:hypothetical protein n=1 Tax=Paenibacillus TaxID=44249 RepID=UPI001B062749|nr:hypothetical protein [Paenibacillus dendritiformis]GIO78473.1 hypothetical protein J6TS7_20830 [Paenibacillus dendritiformis]
MVISSVFVFIGIFLVTLISLQGWIPGFENQKKYSSRTVQLAMEMSGSLKQTGLVNFLMEKAFPQIKKIFGIEYLLGPKMKNMVEVLGEYSTVEEMIAKKFVRSVLFSLPTLLLIVVAPALAIAFPINAAILFVRDVRDTKKSFEKMQREITKDLPMLIDKIMIALETGKPFIHVFQEVEQSSGPKLKRLLGRLNANMQYMRFHEAMEIFAKETTIPVMMQFSTAVKIGIEQGYESAIEYFDDIKTEISQLRRIAIEELTKGKPGQAQLYTFLMIFVALGSVGIVVYQIFGQLGKIL